MRGLLDFFVRKNGCPICGETKIALKLFGKLRVVNGKDGI